ncbi:unnamed protein product [Bemisia tabaci]|uniref:Ionotropic receptor n=1 Tax=Bemisia tabaci TaxID=7038 RepID=A0A9P0G5P8_BEMTA|nr:unnamed protein product [Bemisia tabaci]
MYQVLNFFRMAALPTTLIFLLLIQRISALEIEDVRHDSLSFIFAMCNYTVQLTQRRLLYIVALQEPGFPVPRLIQDLHDHYIQTTLIVSPRQLMTFVRSPGPNNIIILLNSLNDIPSLILDTATGTDGKLNRGEVNLIQNNATNITFPCGKKADPSLPNYCIRTNDLPDAGVDRICDVQLNISSAELENNGELTNEVHELTKGLYVHDIWNSRNRLIFVICGAHGSRDSYGKAILDTIAPSEESKWELNEYSTASRELMFVFRFIWRMFSGHKSVICYEDSCFKYDPFAQKLLRFFSHNKENFLQFPIKNMHQMTVICPASTEKDYLFGPTLILQEQKMDDLMGEIMYDLSVDLNCTFATYARGFLSDTTCGELDMEQGHKIGAKLYILGESKFLRPEDFSKFDQTTSVESYAVSVITPRSPFIPQSAVAFKCYSLAVWIFIFITIILFLMMQAFLQHVFYRTLQYIRGGEDVNQDEVSVFLTIYAYFICGQPPRLILGHLYTSRIVFVIVIFASMILSGLFQNGMVTLLSARVRFPDIDTLEELAQSDLRIQVQGIESTSLFFEEQPLFQGLKDKLTDFFSFQMRGVLSSLVGSNDTTILYSYIWTGGAPSNISAVEMNIVHSYDRVFDKLRRSLQSDAFLVNSPLLVLRGNYFLFEHWLFRDRKMAYHKVGENVMTYPYAYKILKNTFLFEAINERLTRLVENGLLRKYLPYLLGQESTGVSTEENVAMPRVFDMNDLQIAFLFLSAGLLLSCIAFVVELLIQP